MKVISVDDLHTILEIKEQGKGETFLVVDARGPEMYAEGHLPGAVNIPASKIMESLEVLQNYDAVYIHCNTGNTSGQACHTLNEAGFENAYNVEGGITAWKEAGYPVDLTPNEL